MALVTMFYFLLGFRAARENSQEGGSSPLVYCITRLTKGDFRLVLVLDLVLVSDMY